MYVNLMILCTLLLLVGCTVDTTPYFAPEIPREPLYAHSPDVYWDDDSVHNKSFMMTMNPHLNYVSVENIMYMKICVCQRRPFTFLNPGNGE